VSLKDVVDDEVAAVSTRAGFQQPGFSPGHNGQQQGDVDPAEQGELLSQILLVQVADEANEA
jgi:hypothetical protein